MIKLKRSLTRFYHQKSLSKINITQTKATKLIKIREYIPQVSTQRKKVNCLKDNVYFAEKNRICKCQNLINYVIIDLKVIILYQNVNQKTHVSKLVVPQNTTQLFTNISRQIKGIEERKENSKQNSYIQREKGKNQSFTNMIKESQRRFLCNYYQLKLFTEEQRRLMRYWTIAVKVP